jgi:hypothetical protein
MSAFIVLMDILNASNIEDIIKMPYFRFCIPLYSNARYLDNIPYPFGKIPMDEALYMTTSSPEMDEIMKEVAKGIKPMNIDSSDLNIVRLYENELKEMIEPLKMMYIMAFQAFRDKQPFSLPILSVSEKAKNGLRYYPEDISIFKEEEDGYQPNLEFFQKWDQNIKDDVNCIVLPSKDVKKLSIQIENVMKMLEGIGIEINAKMSSEDLKNFNRMVSSMGGISLIVNNYMR